MWAHLCTNIYHFYLCVGCVLLWLILLFITYWIIRLNLSLYYDRNLIWESHGSQLLYIEPHHFNTKTFFCCFQAMLQPSYPLIYHYIWQKQHIMTFSNITAVYGLWSQTLAWMLNPISIPHFLHNAYWAYSLCHINSHIFLLHNKNYSMRSVSSLHIGKYQSTSHRPKLCYTILNYVNFIKENHNKKSVTVKT
jgi:hypothetical protein